MAKLLCLMGKLSFRLWVKQQQQQQMIIGRDRDRVGRGYNMPVVILKLFNEGNYLIMIVFWIMEQMKFWT